MDRSRFNMMLPDTVVNRHKLAFVGVGALGSHMALSAAKLGFEVGLFDPDTVDESNVQTQAFLGYQVGEPKAGALRDLVGMIEGKEAQAVPYAVRPGLVDLSQYSMVILSPDSLDARSEIFQALLEGAPRQYFHYEEDCDCHDCNDAREREAAQENDPTHFPWQLVVDVRMNQESMEIYLLKGREEVERHIEQTITGVTINGPTCGATSLPYTGPGAAAFVMPLIRRHALGFDTPHTVLVDLASSGGRSMWREGERFVPEDPAGGRPLEKRT